MYIERADILYSVELRDQSHNSTYSLMRFSLYLLTIVLGLFLSSLTIVGLALFSSFLNFFELVLSFSLSTDDGALFLSFFKSEDVDLLFPSSSPAKIDVPSCLSFLPEPSFRFFFLYYQPMGLNPPHPPFCWFYCTKR